mmetsp:Transcript_25120/g.53123  ORF Transcript_25120/g.53123 Transcript_25120/m.53123 type:complete len:80 (-) Transcript_25120:535-774(-)
MAELETGREGLCPLETISSGAPSIAVDVEDSTTDGFTEAIFCDWNGGNRAVVVVGGGKGGGGDVELLDSSSILYNDSNT